MLYSEIKELKKFCDGLLSLPDYKEVVAKMKDGVTDFDNFGARFIRKDIIDKVMQEELESDLYILGSFNSDFLASILDIDQDVIEAFQEEEAFEAVGKLVLSLDKLEELQQAYKDIDGYGHHFNHWDGTEEEIFNYYVFDNMD